MQEERNPLFDVSVVSSRAALEFITTVGMPEELSVAESDNDVDVADTVNAAGVYSHARLL